MIRVILFAMTLGFVFSADVDVQATEKSKNSNKLSLYQYEKLIKEMIYKINRLSSELKYVKDEKTAKRANSSIERLLGQLTSLTKKMQKLTPPSPDMQKELNEKYEAKMKAAGLEFSSLVMGLEKKEYASEILQMLRGSTN